MQFQTVIKNKTTNCHKQKGKSEKKEKEKETDRRKT